MVTKAEVRALALARLGPRPGVLVWDVGAGSGSVAVECARLGAAVIAVDRDPAQCARVATNADRHQVGIRVVSGAAPQVLDGLPDPDAVFVGGGGTDVVRAVAARRPARIVVARCVTYWLLPVTGWTARCCSRAAWPGCPMAPTGWPPLTRCSCSGGWPTMIVVSIGRLVTQIDQDHGERWEQ
jgi:precorrin-6Y C5,15-methyltransferase (decarboxylating) CbiT subunit